jgi:hypothetical protein
VCSCAPSDDFGFDDCLEARGPLVTENIELEAFNQVSFEGFGNIFMRKGTQYGVEVITNENVIPILNFEVENGELEISFDQCVNRLGLSGLQITITTADLNAVSVSGTGSFVSDTLWSTGTFNLDVTGNWVTGLTGIVNERLIVDAEGQGTLIFEGAVDIHDIEVDGGLLYESFDLESNTCFIDAEGAHILEVTVADTLNIDFEGAGEVRYKGDPAIFPELDGDIEIINSN